MKKVVDTFKDNERTFSFELFPPKTEKGYQNLLKTITGLAELKPDYISCTYGAGGGNREKTFEIVEHIEKEHGIIGMAHLTCVLNTREDITNILKDIHGRGIRNILALRGDPPKDHPNWKPGDENLKYSSELCAFIREHYGDEFGIAVAGFPEGHILCRDRDKDAYYLKLKIDSGADFVITQLFFNNQDYYDYIKRLRKLGIENRVLPGILPVTNYQSLQNFCKLCGATITEEIRRIFEPIADDQEKTLKAGIDFAVKQCRDLLDNGAPGIHLYALNKLHPTIEIMKQIRN